MGAHAIHLVKHPVRLPVQVAFNPQCGKLVGHHPQVPPARVGMRILARTVSQDFRRRGAFIARTEWAESALQCDTLTGKISGALGTVSGNNHPASGNGVFSQLRHGYYLTALAIYSEDV